MHRIAAALTLFAVAFVSLSVYRYTRTSATWDEPQHLTAGYLALTRHDYRLDPEHPPFARMWAALPLLALGPLRVDTSAIDAARDGNWLSLGQVAFSHRFLYVDHDADRLLYAARFMIVLLGLLLGGLIFGWVHEWLGFWPAALALGFYTLEPNLAAHASLVTTDFGVTCFIFGTVYFLWRVCRRASPWNVAGLTLFFVLAILTKFSALILVPIVPLILLGVLATRTPPIAPRRVVSILALLALAAWLAVWAAYAFRYTPSAVADWRFHFHDDPVVAARVPAVTAIATRVDAWHLLPNAFAQGFLVGQAKAQQRQGFLAGEYSDDGWWYYFPVAFAIKTPLSLIALIAIGVCLFAARWRRVNPDTVLFLVLPVGAYCTWALATRLNIGLRHLLPIYPFLIVLATLAATWLTGDGRRRRGWRGGRAGQLVLAALVACWLFEVGRVYPDTLAFFNSAIGGPARGAEYLVDSNLDWGQDLKPLKRWMEARGVSHVNLAYFGTADPAYYGIQATHLPDGWILAPDDQPPPRWPAYVAVSETVLTGVYASERTRDFYRPLRGLTPVARIGRSIRMYWIERPWW